MQKVQNHLFTPKRRLVLIIVILISAYGVFAWSYLSRKDSTDVVLDSTALSSDTLSAPEFSTEQIATGYSNIWDMVFLSENEMLFDERSGRLHTLNMQTGETKNIGTVPNVRAEGEGGLLGLALDKDFSENRYVYACYNHNGAVRSVRVTRFELDTQNQPSGYIDIIDDIDSKAGRHSGCRMAMDSSGHLWIGTGDSAIGNAPQNTASLAGKVLRVDRQGQAVEGNAQPPFDERIYNFGHRNIQGLLLFDTPLPNGAIGLTSEHGPDKQDEINWILPGNFGWDPSSGSSYDESVPMTDSRRYPNAREAIWNSGDQTIAVAGLGQLSDAKWQAWQGWIALASLKGKHLRLLDISPEWTIRAEREIVTDFGRLRAVRQGPDGNVYISTDNSGGKDGIIRMKP